MTPQSLDSYSLLRKSFIHLKGIGARTERHLWSQGIMDWSTLLREGPKLFGSKRFDLVGPDLKASIQAWDEGDLYYFQQKLPSRERWRMILGGFSDIAYFDIEATGGGQPPLAQSTVIAFLFKGQLLQEHLHDRKLELIEYILNEASMLCSFNGAAYDLPFLAKEYQMNFPIAHIDLCPWIKGQGYKGGLKALQKSFPHLHQRSSFDLNGYDAVKLWRLYEQGVDEALTTLASYNAEDVLILHPLLVEAYNRESLANPILAAGELRLEALPPLNTRVSEEIYRQIREMHAFA